MSNKGCTKFITMAIVLVAMSFGVRPAFAIDSNPYPTPTIADYVFACMSSNGQTREALEGCSCSIDVIASIIPFTDYEQAETVLQLRRQTGEKAALFKTSARWKQAVDRLRRAQAEAEVRCF